MKKSFLLIALVLPLALFLSSEGALIAENATDRAEILSYVSKVTALGDEIVTAATPNGTSTTACPSASWRDYARLAGIDISLDLSVSQRIDLVAEMRAELAPCPQTVDFANLELACMTGVTDISKLDSILVGRNLIYSPEWLKYIGDTDKGALITQENFEKWRDRSDMAYEAYALLTGTLPMQGRRIFIDLNRLEHTKEQSFCAHAHRFENRICFNTDYVATELALVQRYDSWSFSKMHEIGHMFDYGEGTESQLWNAEGETLATFKLVFAMQFLDANILDHEVSNSKILDKLCGYKFQGLIIEKTRQKYADNDIRPFSTGGRGTFSAFDMCLHNLAQQYGWEPIMLAFRSYNNQILEDMLDTKQIGNGSRSRARCFIERIAFFTGDPSALCNIIDNDFLNCEFPLNPNS